MHRQQRIFYGWVVVGAVFTICFVAFGAAYSFGSFVVPLEAEFRASRGLVSTIFAATGALYFAAGIVTGPLADRFGTRPLALAGALLTGAGLVAAALAPSLPLVFSAYVIGVGTGVGCAYVPAVAVVQKWFVAKRALASGIAVSGIGLGTLCVPPLATALIGGLGWRTAYIVLGAAAVFIGAGAALFLRDDPAALGLHRDGLKTAGPLAVVDKGPPVREIVRTRAFVILYVGTLLIGIGAFIPFVHLVPYAVDRGVAMAHATWLVALIGAGSILGRFVIAGAADRMGRRRVLVATTAGMACVSALWPLLPGLLTLAAFALLFGVLYGGWVALLPSLTADWFGVGRIGGVLGVLYTSVAFGTLAGPSAAGFMFDLTRRYVVTAWAAAVAGLAGSWLIARITAPAQ